MRKMGSWTEWVVASAIDLEGKKIIGNTVKSEEEIDITSKGKNIKTLDFLPHHETWGWKGDPEEFDDTPEAMADNRKWVHNMDANLRAFLTVTMGDELVVFRVGLSGDNNGDFMFNLTERGYAHDGACRLVQVFGSMGIRAVALSYDELVMGPEYVRPLAWSGVPTDAVEEYRSMSYKLCSAHNGREYEHRAIADMEDSHTYSSTGIYGMSTKNGMLTYDRVRGEQPFEV
jgi:hypothetical protein